ncbi:MAG TPA: 5-(carboxyamino)imidazole ribonucleotide synthase [Caldimonas sp.]|nr:5-(carboxyamino)imidazole ribonucleotide synthase [Caldimonas sp.]HEX4234425.1 5-(carboxyamino)imidazole ribonucleotide synthase [Caldimonas sp.]
MAGPRSQRGDEASASPFIAPGATLGVLGGGQLGRMFVHAAQAMGYRTAVLDPDSSSPAGLVSHEHIRADYLDPAALARLAERCAAVTTEFENVPAAALETLARRRPVAPAAASVAVCQDRAAEKAAFARSGVACAPHAKITSRGDLARVDDALLPGILKTARLGYDGKGQQSVRDRAGLAAAFDALGGVPSVLEKRLPLAAEISVVVARSAWGDVVHLPVHDNVHAGGILAVTRVLPGGPVAAATAAEAIVLAERLASALDHVGVLCVEFFVLEGGALVANEMAPRPHNSGHHSIDSCDVSQFELQVRAMTGAPLVAPRQHSPAVMLNLLGDLWTGGVAPDWREVLALPGAHLHLYGKTEPRPGRKMGHLTIIAASAGAAEANAAEAARRLGLASFGAAAGTS